jgi:hypothetical protein
MWGSNRAINNPAGLQPLVVTGERTKDEEFNRRGGRRSDKDDRDEKEKLTSAVAKEDERELTEEEQKRYQSLIGSLI